MRSPSQSVLTLAVLAFAGSAGLADVVYQGRFVQVRVGPGGIEVRTPAIGVEVRPNALQPGIPVQPPPGVPLEIGPPARPVPPVIGQPSVHPPTLEEFAAAFKPCPGNFEVVLLHPFTNAPVKVCFALPPGTPRVTVGGQLRRCLEFNYGKREIEIWFYRDGRVKVKG